MSTEAQTPSAFAVPARQIALLPDGHFFVRVVPLVTGEGADTPEAQVELAVETLSPFPVSQLYYGFRTRPGLDRALVFASYRKRFPADETEGWAQADLVAPRFAALLGAPPPPGATTWLIEAEDGVTAVHFPDESGVPADVSVYPIAHDADAPARAAARDALLRSFPGSRVVVDLPVPTLDAEASNERELVFRAGELTSNLPVDQAEALDVRDKAEVGARRQARARDQWLWRGLLAFAAILVLCGLAEVGLIAGRMWQQTRATQVLVQKPDVDSIVTKRTLATRIEELSSRRLLPLEMVSVISAARPGGNIQFLSMNTTDLYTLQLDAQTPSGAQGEIDALQSALLKLEACETVDVQGPEIRAGVAAFRLTVTFRPDALKPADS
jgi:hypothetical protein